MNWLATILCILAGGCALWAFAGLMAPQAALSFALPARQSRDNAFGFPMRLAVICAIAAAGSIYGADDIGIAMWAGLISGLLFWKACQRFNHLRGTPLQRMGIILPD